MPKIPVLSGSQVTRGLEKLGFVQVRQRGSHLVFRRGSSGCVVPKHKEIKIGTLAGILKQAGITVEEFLAVL
jgi:predicted RNA binding protein YcfA (HicA-like mRNA interferase family)